MEKIFLDMRTGTIAGGGGTTMFLESTSFLKEVVGDCGYIYKVTSPPSGLFVPDFPFAFSAGDYEGRHREAREFATTLMASLGPAVKVVVFAREYTSYIPWAFHPWVEQGQVQVIWGDSSPPDTEAFDRGISEGRFVESAYRDTTFFLWCGHGFKTTPAIKRRIPKETRYSQSARPLSPQYISFLENLGDRRQCRSWLRKRGWNLADDDIVLLLAASDVWDPEAVGKWMTKEQYLDGVETTENLLRAIDSFVGTEKKRAWLFANPAIRSLGGQLPLKIVCGDWPRGIYLRLLGSANVIIARTTNCISVAEAQLIGNAPLLPILIPKLNYMNVESFLDSAIKRGIVFAIRPGEYSEKNIAESLAKLIGDETLATRLMCCAREEFFSHNREKNFFELISTVI